jgi:hypothetical protein|tara:strand:- start:7894 stop:8226 length:333 start_codon:yes stop_codon:yes gene_type:complete
MKDELAELMVNIQQDYYNWWSRRDSSLSESQLKMIEEFNEGLISKQGNKYIKIIAKNSVWGFIVNTENDKKFKLGDILKPAGWAAPARNAARGNILDGGYDIQWTGPKYL